MQYYDNELVSAANANVRAVVDHQDAVVRQSPQTDLYSDRADEARRRLDSAVIEYVKERGLKWQL